MYMYTYIIVKSQLHSLVVLVVSNQLTLSEGIVYIFIFLCINKIFSENICFKYNHEVYVYIYNSYITINSLVVLVVSIQLTLSGGIVYIFISLYINNILNIYMC